VRRVARIVNGWRFSRRRQRRSDRRHRGELNSFPNGEITIPEGPGLGVTIDEAAPKRLRADPLGTNQQEEKL